MSVHVPSTVPAAYRGRIEQVLKDRETFCQMLQIKHKQQRKFVPFSPNDAQKRLWKVLDEHSRVIVVKARQVGISTATRAWQFHRAYTTPHPEVFAVLSFHDRSARNLRRMDRAWLRGLPSLMQRPLALDSATDSEFEDTGAGVSSFTTGGRGGTRSYDFTGAHLSEFAFYTDPGEVLSQVVSTVGDGSLVIESTANAPGDAFHRLIEGAPENGWHVFTYWWWQHKAYRDAVVPPDFVRSEQEDELASRFGLTDRQLSWRRRQIGTLGAARFRREYPADLADAFASREATWFRAEDLDKIAGVWFDTAERELVPPKEDAEYVMGVDISGGVGQDYSALCIVDVASRQPVYFERSNTMAPHAWAARAATLGQRYNQAIILAESNNHGFSFLREVQVLRYPRLWQDHEGKFWYTTVSSKLDAYDGLREVVEAGIIQQIDHATLQELRGLEVRKVTPEAPSGLHDDLAMATALAYRCLRDAPLLLRQRATAGRIEELKTRKRAEERRRQALAWRTTQ